jgi:CCR4-NOT transcription complex subunit 1
LPAGTTLVQTLVDLGPDITSDPEVVRALLNRFGITEANPPRDAETQEIVSTLARAAVEGRTLCDVNSLMAALTSFVRLLALINISYD